MDFSKMLYNISIIPENELAIEFFPDLANFDEYKNPNNDKILRVGFLATDQESPFVKSERENYEARLTKIFDYLKIKDDKLLGKLITGSNEDYENIVNRFFIQCDNLAYIMWSNKLRMFHYIGQMLRKEPDAEDVVGDMTKRAVLDVKLKDIYNDLVEYESVIFTDTPTRRKVRNVLTKLIQPAEKYAVNKTVV